MLDFFNFKQLFLLNSLEYKIPFLISLMPGFLLFIVGFCGVLYNKNKNLLQILLSAELSFLGISLLFILVSVYYQHPEGQIFALFLLAFSAVDSALFLSLIIVCYKLKKNITVNVLNTLQS